MTLTLSARVLGVAALLAGCALLAYGQGERGTPPTRRPGRGSANSGGKLTPPTTVPVTTPSPTSGPDRGRVPNRRSSTIDPATIVPLLAKSEPFFQIAARGLPVNVSQEEINALESRLDANQTQRAIVFGELRAFSIGQAAPKTNERSPGRDRGVPAFGPHLFTSEAVARNSHTADKFLAASQKLKEELGLSAAEAKILRAVPLTTIKEAFDCPYDDAIQCNPSSKYRTFDGSCNNLANPILGRANTPFERFLPSQYEDGIGAMKVTGQGSKQPLPNARVISSGFHTVSTPQHRQVGVSLFTMIMGQFVSHDINMNTISRGIPGVFLSCCNTDGRVTSDPQMIELGCSPIEIPANDPYYSQFATKRCLSFKRALGGTDLRCRFGGREQTNQVTHYLDGSTVYGSSIQQATNLRLFSGGLLKAGIAPDGRELLLQNPALTGSFSCRSQAGSTNHCFTAGDVRVNQNPGLMSIHTLFLREHNRVATELASLNPNWNDEKLFQEARKVVVAILQNIVYDEYLPVLLSRPMAQGFGLVAKNSGYYTHYSELTNPSIRNGFVAAAYRCGHSNIDDILAPGVALSSSFNNPSAIYSPGINNLTLGLTGEYQQTMDRRDADTITNRLFEASHGDGTGTDLPAINIQRGRDHGLASYNDYREFCNYPRARFFSRRTGGLIHHHTEAITILSKLYKHVDDIDPWTGMSSELPLEGGVFGPTAACLTALQFNFLKQGDRFYYENNNPDTRFSPEQLDSIRKITLSSLLCANTGRQNVAKNSFRTPDFFSNPQFRCDSGQIPSLDLAPWQETNNCVDGGWSPWLSWTQCSIYGIRFRFRFCDNPPKSECGKDCEGPTWEYRDCIFNGIFNQGRKGNARVDPRTTPTPLNGNDPADASKILEVAKSLAPSGVRFTN